MTLSRRNFLSQTVLAASTSTLPSLVFVNRAHAENSATQSKMTLGFSTYGARLLATEKTIELLQETGYDAVEISVSPDWDAAPSNMPSGRRKKIRKQLEDSGLKLTSLMEHLYPESDDTQHKVSLERLRTVYQLAIDLCPEAPPLVQTVLGGGIWDEKKSLFADRVGDWTSLGKSFGVVTCVKPHRGGGMSRPSEGVWLINQIGDAQWLKIVYDYSHYAFRNIPLAESIKAALPHIGHVAVKDAVQTATKNKDGSAGEPRVEFRLPGEAGTIDFVTLLQTLHAGGYAGDISCEVSGMVWNKRGYDPTMAMQTCFANMSKAFRDAGVTRV